MKDIFQDITRWVSNAAPFALATVSKTWGSAPRGVGSAMIVSEDSRVAGSVSGGCVEGAVIEEALKVLQSGKTRVNDDGTVVVSRLTIHKAPCRLKIRQDSTKP